MCELSDLETSELKGLSSYHDTPCITDYIQYIVNSDLPHVNHT